MYVKPENISKRNPVKMRESSELHGETSGELVFLRDRTRRCVLTWAPLNVTASIRSAAEPRVVTGRPSVLLPPGSRCKINISPPLSAGLRRHGSSMQHPAVWQPLAAQTGSVDLTPAKMLSGSGRNQTLDLQGLRKEKEEQNQKHDAHLHRFWRQR